MANQQVTQVSGQVNNVAASAESAIITSPVLNVNAPGAAGVFIEATLTYLAGTTTTAVVIRIRAGSGTGGAILATGTFTVTAAGTYSLSLNWLDATPLPGPSQAQYTVTLQQTGGTAAGNANGTLATIVSTPAG